MAIYSRSSVQNVKRLIDKLAEECSENIDGNERINNDYRNVCNSCTVYIVTLYYLSLLF